MMQSKIARSLVNWFVRNARDLPWRQTRDPYAIWVSEIMLQQTQVKTVMPYWSRWMRAFPTLAALARARPERIHKLWEGLGYYTRVRNLQKAAQIVMREHGGRFPERFAEVLALPGIGRYTAGAICSIAFNQPYPVLDGNVLRVLARLHGIGDDPGDSRTKARLWGLAEELVQEAADISPQPLHAPRTTHPAPSSPSPDRSPCSQLNQSLMELGAVICTPRQPQCALCPVARYCVAHRQGRVAQFPAPRRRIPVTPRRFAAFVLRKGDRFLVRQRPAGGVNAHLWEFPNTEIVPGETDFQQAARKVLGRIPRRLESLCTLKHSITRYRITLEVYRVLGGRASSGPAGRWVNRRALGRLPFASAHKRILQRLAGNT